MRQEASLHSRSDTTYSATADENAAVLEAVL